MELIRQLLESRKTRRLNDIELAELRVFLRQFERPPNPLSRPAGYAVLAIRLEQAGGPCRTPPDLAFLFHVLDVNDECNASAPAPNPTAAEARATEPQNPADPLMEYRRRAESGYSKLAAESDGWNYHKPTDDELTTAYGYWFCIPHMAEAAGDRIPHALDRLHRNSAHLLMAAAERRGLDSGPIHTAQRICQRLIRKGVLRSRGGQYDTWPDCISDDVLESLNSDDRRAIEAAERLISQLNIRLDFETGGGAKPKRKSGRPKGATDSDPHADQKIREAWNSGHYGTYSELDAKLKMPHGSTLRALDRHRKREKKRREKEGG